MQAAAPRRNAAPWLPRVRRWQVDARSRRMIAVAAVLVGVFAALAMLLRQAGGSPFDIAVTWAIQQVDSPIVTVVMVAISAPGYSPWGIVTVGAASLLLTLGRRFPEAIFVLLTEGAGTLVAQIKPVIARPRPSGDSIRIVAAVLDYSYPSGHVVGYVALYGFMFFLVFVLYRRSLARTLMLTVLGALVALIGVSRMYLGHHWASDVLGGYALGTAYLLLLIVLYRVLVAHPAAQHAASATTGADVLDPGTHRAFEVSHAVRRVRPGNDGA